MNPTMFFIYKDALIACKTRLFVTFTSLIQMKGLKTFQMYENGF